jgi:hypothetical protein
MDEQALRALVREAVARHLPGAGEASAALSRDPGWPTPVPSPRGPLAAAAHASHGRYILIKTDGPCLIEPTVQCNHCGYCESHGH